MPDRFYLIRGTCCTRCQGSGQVNHKLLSVWKTWKRDPDDFFRQHRIMGSDVENPIKCPACGGSGEIRSETTLAAALTEMGLLVEEATGESHPEPA